LSFHKDIFDKDFNITATKECRRNGNLKEFYLLDSTTVHVSQQKNE